MTTKSDAAQANTPTTSLASMKRDAIRLAWLDAQVAGYASPNDPYEHEGNSWSISGQFSSIRDAIDYGMQQDAQQIDCPVCGKPGPVSCGMCSEDTTPTPVTVERLRKLIELTENARDLSAGYLRVDPEHSQTLGYLKNCEDELSALRELLAARETIAKLREAVPALERAAKKLHEHACECDHPTCDIPHDYKKLHSLAARMKS